MALSSWEKTLHSLFSAWPLLSWDAHGHRYSHVPRSRLALLWSKWLLQGQSSPFLSCAFSFLSAMPLSNQEN